MNSDIIGSIGVTLMLTAFLLNILDKLDNNNILYILLNFFGGIMACIASYFISYTPFIILEGVWSIVSGWAVYDFIQKKLKNGKDEKNS
jgi:membrane associated rhomboid family serine protease